MSLPVFSCKPEGCGAGGGKAAVRGSAVSHDPGAGYGARRQDRLAVGLLALSVVCTGSHSCVLGLLVESTSHAPREVSLPHLFQTTPSILVSFTWKHVGLQAWEKLICPPETTLIPKKQRGKKPPPSPAVAQAGISVCPSCPYTALDAPVGVRSAHHSCACPQLHPEQVVNITPLAIAPHRIPVAGSPQHCLVPSHQAPSHRTGLQTLLKLPCVVWAHPAWLSLVLVQYL